MSEKTELERTIEVRLIGEWTKVRALHSAVPVPVSMGMRINASTGEVSTAQKLGLECEGCRRHSLARTWPCATARIVYTPAEIEKAHVLTHEGTAL